MIWIVAAYVGVGFFLALVATSDEAIAYYRLLPKIQHLGTAALGIAIFLMALIVVAGWPFVLMSVDWSEE